MSMKFSFDKNKSSKILSIQRLFNVQNPGLKTMRIKKFPTRRKKKNALLKMRKIWITRLLFDFEYQKIVMVYPITFRQRQ